MRLHGGPAAEGWHDRGFAASSHPDEAGAFQGTCSCRCVRREFRDRRRALDQPDALFGQGTASWRRSKPCRPSISSPQFHARTRRISSKHLKYNDRRRFGQLVREKVTWCTCRCHGVRLELDRPPTQMKSIDVISLKALGDAWQADAQPRNSKACAAVLISPCQYGPWHMASPAGSAARRSRS